MINRFVHILLYIIAIACPAIAIANNPYREIFASSDSIHADKSCVVREQLPRGKFMKITFLDDSCNTTCPVNKGIDHYELSEYLHRQEEKLHQMALEILNVFSDEDLETFKTLKIVPCIQCTLTVSKDGRIINTSLYIPTKVSAAISDQRLREIKDIMIHTRLDVIPYETSAVRFSWSIPRKLFAPLLEPQN